MHGIGRRCWSVKLLLMSCCGADGCALLNEERSDGDLLYLMNAEGRLPQQFGRQWKSRSATSQATVVEA